MRKILILTFIVVGLDDSLAQIIPNNQQTPAERILQQQQIERQQQKLHEEPAIIEQPTTEPKTRPTPTYCIEVKSVAIQGVTLFPPHEKKQWVKQMIGSCIDQNQIGELLKIITNFYLERGYSTARAYFVEYNSKTEELTIRIDEGKISSLKLNTIKNDKETHNSLSDRAQIYTAFPTRAGKVLNVMDLEQGINQMNKLQSNNATLDIRPAACEGEAEVQVTNRQGKTSMPNISYDNSGSKSTGVYNTTYGFNQDNLLRINDNLTLMKIISSSSKTDLIRFSAPFGYYTFSYNGTHNKYHSTADNGVNIRGTQTTQGFKLERLLFRNQKHQLDLSTKLDLQDKTLDVGNETLMHSQRLSAGRIGLDYKFQLPRGALLVGAEASRGLKIANAIKDDNSPTPLTKDSPRAQFEKYRYHLNFYSELLNYFTYTLQVEAQYSPDSLYSSELLYVGGGEYTVRGLKYTGINGSKGAFGRSELSLNLRKLDFLYPRTEANSLVAKTWNYALNEARNLSPYIFYDTGLTRAVTAISQDLKTEYITGTGAGIRYNGKYLRAGIAYARSLRAPNYILAQNNYSKSAVYFNVGGQVWF